jgi:uncharacterized membrane protein YfcA
MSATLAPFIIAGVGGAVIGLLLAVFGGGGSVLATPLLVYGVGVRDPHVAIGTSAAAVALNAAASLAAHGAAGRVKWPCALLFGAGGLTGVLAGAQLAKQTDGARLLLWFALAMAVVGVSMLIPKKTEGDPEVRLTLDRAVKLVPLGFVTGAASGFFGIGGGFLIVPGLIAATGMPLAYAAASSLVSVALFGAATSASYAVSGLIDWPIFLALAAGGMVGSLAGLPIAKRLARHAGAARRGFAVMVLTTAAYVAWRAFGQVG